MTRKGTHILVFVTVCVLLGMLAITTPAVGEAPRMTIQKLKENLGSPDLIILDVRYGIGWSLSLQKIKGALREDPKKKTSDWADKYSTDKTIVLYCG